MNSMTAIPAVRVTLLSGRGNPTDLYVLGLHGEQVNRHPAFASRGKYASTAQRSLEVQVRNIDAYLCYKERKARNG